MTDQQIAFRNLQETARHNRETEALGRDTLAESKRHSIMTEDINAAANVINKEHYERQDAINDSHYRRSDAINALHYANQDAYTAAHYANQDFENFRHDSAVERETKRANEAKELQNRMDWHEIKRHNVAAESTIPSEVKYTESKTKGQDISNAFAPVEKTVNIVQDVWSMVTDTVNAGSNLLRSGTGAIKNITGALKDLDLTIKIPGIN